MTRNNPQPDHPKATLRGRLINLVLTVVSLAFVALVAEVGLRLVARWTESERRAALEQIEQQRKPAKGAEVWQLRDVLRRVENPRLVYVLKPDLDVLFYGEPLRTNSHGFRGADTAVEKRPGTVRVVGIGDSVMFGWRVKEADAYLWRVADELSTSEAPWEAINTAVPGYNGVMQVEALKTLGARFSPDLVIVGYVSNDFDLPNFLLPDTGYTSLDRSYLWELVQAAIRGRGDTDGLTPRPETVGMDMTDEERQAVSAAYRHLVGIEAYRGAMRELSALKSTQGFEVLVVTHGRFPESLRELYEEFKFPHVECAEGLESFADSRNLRPSELLISITDPHPNALGHEAIAGVIVTYLRESGIAARLIAKAREEK